ncbi:amino acid/polyamine transporter I, partial [Pavlovales sp. CCMP2436]
MPSGKTILDRLMPPADDVMKLLSRSPASPATAAKPDTRAAPRQLLTGVQLLFITYACVCGGPFGIEPVVRVMGPFVTLLLLCVIPLVWSLQEALMTAELSTALPEMGGFVIWLQRGLGETAAQQVGYWRVVSSVFDVASYPLLMLSYLPPSYVGEDGLSLAARWAFGTSVLFAAAALNCHGVEMVGNTSSLLCVMVLLPFSVFFAVGLPSISPDALTTLPPAGTLRSDGLSILLWNLSYFDLAGTFASEVRDPQKVFLPAMLGALALALAAYILPLLVGVSVATDYSAWREGYFVQIAAQVGGSWLGAWLSITGAVCAFAILNSILSTNSRVLVALAQLGVAPAALGVLHPTRDTPVRATAVTVLCSSALLLVGEWELSMSLYMLSTAAEFVALANLRTLEPELH